MNNERKIVSISHTSGTSSDSAWETNLDLGERFTSAKISGEGDQEIRVRANPTSREESSDDRWRLPGVRILREDKERKGETVVARRGGRDARSIGNRDASVQMGCALETELEDAPTRRDVAVVDDDDVVDGLWLNLILTLRVYSFVV